PQGRIVPGQIDGKGRLEGPPAAAVQASGRAHDVLVARGPDVRPVDVEQLPVVQPIEQQKLAVARMKIGAADAADAVLDIHAQGNVPRMTRRAEGAPVLSARG